MRHRLSLLLLAIGLSALSCRAATAECRTAKLEVERLPSLNIPRSGHSVLFLNGELTVFGGHTSGFVPTPTAEYFKDGAWHTAAMTYSHDAGAVLQLKSGKVLLAGGFERNLGIGQTFEAETYNPLTHSFEGFGCLGTKRAIFSALEIDSSQVLISGNWYHHDDMERYDGHSGFQMLKKSSAERSAPYIFRTSADNAVIFGSRDNYGKPMDTIVIDRLKGEPFTIPLFDEWKPAAVHTLSVSSCAFIGDEAKGDFSYLFIVENSEGQLAIARIKNGAFSLLPTSTSVPTSFEGRPITYPTTLVADRERQRAYLLGEDLETEETFHLYILCIDYAAALNEGEAELTLYHTPSASDLPINLPVLTPEGQLVIAGGIDKRHANQNFYPTAAVVLLRMNNEDGQQRGGTLAWPWLAGAGLTALSIALICLCLRRKRTQAPTPTPETPTFSSICMLMEQERPFLNSNLKSSDIAARLDVPVRTITDSIQQARNQKFAEFINAYRVDYVKQLLAAQPDAKVEVLATEAGFSSKTTFFRIFKEVTGMTPTEWKANSQS